ncbi:MAG: hypothetical protein EBV34_14395, partial [Betaproteobacteria bacterium]|nr:hypothetical protein [Betaproteobacteria bacterium]
QSVVKAQVVAQGEAAIALTAAAASGQTNNLLSSFSGAALTSKLDAAAVGSIAQGLDVVTEQTPAGGGGRGSESDSGSDGQIVVGNPGGDRESGGGGGGGGGVGASQNLQLTPPADSGQPGDGVTANTEWSVSGAGSSWEYSLDSGRTFIRGSGSSFNTPAGYYLPGQVQIRGIDLANNRTAPVSYAQSIQIDSGIGAAPTVLAVRGPGDAVYNKGQTLSFTVVTSEPVVVQGIPTLLLGLESGAKTATYASGSGTTALIFNYTVGFGDLATNGITLSGSLAGSVKDAAGNALGALDNVGDLRGIKINGAVVGSAVDGYLINTIIFADADGDNSIDPGEAVGGSIGPGVFSIPGGKGRLIMRGGEDISTGQAFEVQYEAPEGYEVINPVTTLIAQFQDLSGSKQRQAPEAAALLIQSGLFGNLSSTPQAVDLLSYDAFAKAGTQLNATAAQKLEAIAYQKHAAMLATLAATGGKILSTLAATQNSALAKPVIDTSVAIIQAVADQIASLASPSTSTLTGLLTGAANIKQALTSAATALSITLNGSQLNSLDLVAEVLANANLRIQVVDTTAISPPGLSAQQLSDFATTAIRQIVAVQQVVQSGATESLQAFVLDPSNTARIDALLAPSSEQGSLGQLAASAVVGPIFPSRFKVTVSSLDDPNHQGSELSANEGTSTGADQLITYIITRSGGLDGTVVLRYEVSGAATLTSARFTGLSGTALPSGEIKFGPGESQKVISLGLRNDAVDQSNELIVLKLTDVYGNSQFADPNGNLLAYGEARLLLLDDDPNTPLITGPLGDDPNTPAVEGDKKLTLIAANPTKLPALSVDYFDPTASFTATISTRGATLNAQGILTASNTANRWNLVAPTANGSTTVLSLDQLNQALSNLSQALSLEASPLSSAPTASGTLRLDVTPQGRNVTGTYEIALDIRHPPSLSLSESFAAVIAQTQSTLSALGGGNAFAISDMDSASLTATVETSSGILSIATPGEAFVAATTNGLSISGSASALSAALGTLQLKANAGISSATLSIMLTDNDPFTDADGISNQFDWSRQFSIPVRSSPPSLSLPESVQVQLGGSVNLKGIVVSDLDSTTLSLSLIPNIGTIKVVSDLANQNGVSVLTEGLGVRLQGSPANLQTLLDKGVSYSAPVEGGVSPSIAFSLNDPEGNGLQSANAQALALSITLLDNAPPLAGGDLRLVPITGGIESPSLPEDAPPTEVRLRPSVLINPDGETPTQIRILSVDGAGITASDGSPLSLGFKGSTITLVDGAATFKLTPQSNRTEPIRIQYVVLDPQVDSIVSEPSTATLLLDAVNDAPVLEIATSSLRYQEGDGLVDVMRALRLSDVDSSTLYNATVSISSGFIPGDVLTFKPNQALFGNIAGSFNPSTGILTLSSSGSQATVQQFESALRSVSFSNTSDALVTSTRTLTVQVSDSSLPDAGLASAT